MPPAAPVPARNPAPVPVAIPPASGPAAAAPIPVPAEDVEDDDPSNITPMPEDPDAALPDVLSFLDELAVTASEFSDDGRKAVFAKLNEMMGIIGETLAPVASAA